MLKQMNTSKRMIPAELKYAKKQPLYNIHLREIVTVYLHLHKMYFKGCHCCQIAKI